MVERLILNDLVEKETVFKRLIIDYLITITCICYENMFIASLPNASILLQFKPLALRDLMLKLLALEWTHIFTSQSIVFSLYSIVG